MEICTFPKAAFQRVVSEHPALQHRLFKRSLDELDAARDWMLLLAQERRRKGGELSLHAGATQPDGRLPAQEHAWHVDIRSAADAADMADYLASRSRP